MSEPKVVEVTPNVPVAIGAIGRISSEEPRPVAVEYNPPAVFGDDTSVMSVTMPSGGTSGGLDQAFKQMVMEELAVLDTRVDGLENEPDPVATPTGPAGGVLGGTYPDPNFAQPMATQTALTSGLGLKQDRYGLRPGITANAVAGIGELVLVNATNNNITLTPPNNATNGDIVTVIRTDPSSYVVTWNGAVNSDASAELAGQWTGATFVYVNAIWLVLSVNIAYSAAPSASGGQGTGLTREQADARYDLLGAASDAAAGITKGTLGLGNVDNTSDAAKPISTATAAALANKADKSSVINISTGGNVTLNAALGSYQSVTAVNNIVFYPPTNPADQQAMRIEVFTPSGQDRTVSTSSGISNASGFSLPFTVKSGRFAIIGLVYSARTTRWMMVSYTVEP